jgi:hypothetical protein
MEPAFPLGPAPALPAFELDVPPEFNEPLEFEAPPAFATPEPLSAPQEASSCAVNAPTTSPRVRNIIEP